MTKLHVVAVALLLGVAAVFGVLAATRAGDMAPTADAGVSDTAIAARVGKLNDAERAIRRALQDRPPALPAVPATRRPGLTPQQTVYRRPAPLVVLSHSSGHGEYESESEHESGDD
jgi:hypothetical protein